MRHFIKAGPHALGLFLILALGSTAVAADAPAENIEEWLNTALKDRPSDLAKDAAARATSRSTAKQIEAGSDAGNSTSVLDTSSASDLIGIALNLAGLSAASGAGSGDDKGDAISATASFYAFYTALTGKDPLDPNVYCADGSSVWRQFSMTLGYETKGDKTVAKSTGTATGSVELPTGEDAEAGASDEPKASDRVLLGGLKWTLLNGRDACDAKNYREIDAVLPKFAGDYGVQTKRLKQRLVALLERKIAEDPNVRVSVLQLMDISEDEFVKLGPVERQFRMTVLLGETKAFQAVLSHLGQGATEARDAVVEELIPGVTALESAIATTLKKLQQAPQAALEVTTKQQAESTDEYAARLLVDMKLTDILNLTLNGGATVKNGEVKIVGWEVP